MASCGFYLSRLLFYHLYFLSNGRRLCCFGHELHQVKLRGGRLWQEAFRLTAKQQSFHIPQLIGKQRYLFEQQLILGFQSCYVFGLIHSLQMYYPRQV